MKKLITLSILLLMVQFAISQNEENRDSNTNSTLSTSRKGDSPFQGKINRHVKRQDKSGLEPAKLETRINTSRSENNYEETDGAKINMKISNRNRSIEKDDGRRESLQDRDSTFSEDRSTGLKINSRRINLEKKIE